MISRPSALSARTWLQAHTAALVCVVATLARTALAWYTPVTIGMYPQAQVDDLLFMNNAWTIAAGEWLGPYFKWTLVKKPGFALFLALCGILHIRYQLAVIVVYTLGVATFVLALRPLIPRSWLRATLYVALLFAPLMFTRQYFRHVYRDPVSVASALVLLSGYIALYLRRDDDWKARLPWSVVGAAGFAAFVLIKESSLWAMPFVLVCSLVIVGQGAWELRDTRSCQEGLRRLVATVILLALPFAASQAATAAICAKNRAVYGVSLTNKRFEGSFSRVCGQLVDIEPGPEGDIAGVWISTAALERAFAASPTFATAQDGIRSTWQIWAGSFDGRENYGDMSHWALLDGYASAGGCTSATDDEAFWAQVSAELDAAFADGRLTRRAGLHLSQASPPISAGELGEFTSLTTSSVARLLGFGALRANLIADDWQPVWDDTSSQALELAARDFLGGNTLLFEQRAEDVAPTQHLAFRLDNLLGRVGVAASRLATLGLAPTFVALFVLGRRRPGHRVEVALIEAGLLLSAVVFVAAIAWYNSYQLGIYDTASFANQVYCYSVEFYALLMMAEALAYGRLATFLLDLRQHADGSDEG